MIQYTEDDMNVIEAAQAGDFMPEDAPLWLSLCERTFRDRYAAYPEASRTPESELWPDAWKCLPLKNTLIVMASKRFARSSGGIHIPEEARFERQCGWVLSASPQICDPESRAKMLNPPIFKDPLDYVGRTFAWLRAAGTDLHNDPVQGRVGEGTCRILRVEDLVFLMLGMN